MIYFDSHFHFDPEDDLDEVLTRMRTAFTAAGGTQEDELRVAAMGGGWQESLAAQRFARAYPNGIFSAGIHPGAAERETVKPEEFRTLLKDPACKAVGELGLDYFYQDGTRTRQLEILESFLAMALEEDLPVILHCRDQENRWQAYEDMSSLTAAFTGAGGRAVVHCFTGTVPWAECFLAQGCLLGVTGIVTFNRAENVRQVAAMIPEDKLLVETDSPYLAPVPLRGQVNTAGNLPIVIRKLAMVRQDTPEHIAAVTAENAVRFYGLN